MGVDLGPNKVNDGLVFGYDTGYGVADNSTTTRFYPGEPTTNYVTTNLETLATDGSGQSSIGTRTTIAPNHVKIVDINSNTRQTHLISSLTGGTTYTVSIQFKKIEGTPTFRFQLQGYSGSSYVNTIKFTSTAETGLEDIEGWQTAEWTFTLPSNCNALRIWWQDGADYTTYTHSFELKNPQLEAKNHVTPYTSGTRSSTQSLIDLTKTNDIDVSNVSFDSTGQPTFDGTDDRIVVNNFPHIWDGSVTYEGVVSWDDDTRSILFGNYNTGANNINVEKLTSKKLRFYWNDGERDVTTGTNVVTTAGDYHHIVMIRDQSANEFRFYVDGSLVSTVANAGSNVTSTGSTFRIGSDTRTGTTVHNGTIPVTKLYDEVLTADEVKQNFNAYRKRFNL